MTLPTIPRRQLLLGAAASILAAACGPGTADRSEGSPPSSSNGSATTAPVDVGVVETPYRRITATAGTSVQPAVDGDRRLASRLYPLLAADEDNLIFSPYSIATAVSMLVAGAKGETLSQLEDLLGAESEIGAWHESRNALDALITTPAEVDAGAEPLTLNIVNTPFGQAGFEFVDAFLQVLAEQYGADLVATDFAGDPEGARVAINAFVADHTDGRITDLVPEGSIDDMVRLVLVNAILFSAQWFAQFDPARTEPAAFTALDGSTSDVDTMHGSYRGTYAERNGWRMGRLPYWGGFSMVVVLPDEGSFASVTEQLEPLLVEASAIRDDYQVEIAMPKFDITAAADLIGPFRELGVTDVMTPGVADLTGVSTAAELYLSGAFHQATIEVDEFGTTATAATALVVSATSSPPPGELSLDRPFVFWIEHDETSEPLFVGRVVHL